jgi:basic membrane lipoprotein Med (substrate-binding protein (PBP1-ABC) superfamily)
MSDRRKGMINAVKTVFPDSKHRHCVRHLYQNFHTKHKGETLKNDLWEIARSTNIPTWERNMEKLKADNEDAWKWVEELQPNSFVKAFFSDFPKCDMLLNNHSEVFNSYILEARELRISSVFHA